MKPCEKLALEARFLSYVVRDKGCMIWTGGQSRGGKGTDKRVRRGGPYGSFRINREIGVKRAHVVWAWLSGKLDAPYVPAGMNLDHTCDSGPLCVSCTRLIPESQNKSLTHSRYRNADRRAEVARIAERARIERLQSERP